MLDNLSDHSYYYRAMNRRGKYINILVLGFYLFYALLPLLYSAGSEQAEDRANASASLSPVQQSIFERTLLLVPAEDQDTHDSSAARSRILLKKKRAIPPSAKEIVAKLLPQQYAKFYGFELSFKISPAPPSIAGTRKSPNGFRFYHSGISPPSAQSV